MNRSDLEKYHDIAVRLKILTTTAVTDSVKASSADYPYTSHSATVRGVPIPEIESLTRKKKELDAFVDGIEEERAKTLLDMHYRRGLSWAKVASDTGKSIDCNEKYLQRFFRCP